MLIVRLSIGALQRNSVSLAHQSAINATSFPSLPMPTAANTPNNTNNTNTPSADVSAQVVTLQRIQTAGSLDARDKSPSAFLVKTTSLKNKGTGESGMLILGHRGFLFILLFYYFFFIFFYFILFFSSFLPCCCYWLFVWVFFFFFPIFVSY
jgi:hypothetical protein